MGRNILNSIKMSIYEILVNCNYNVKQEYQLYMANRKKRFFLCSMGMVAYLDIKYIILRKTPGKRLTPAMFPETEKKILPSPQELVQELLQADIISFDIFDTLLLRPFGDPKDLFYLVGSELGIANFRILREKAEKETRENSTKPGKEIDIEDIYKTLQNWCAFAKEDGIRTELDMEKVFCFANPYMLQVFELLKQENKTIILLSDMYLTKKMLAEILKKQHITGYDALFVSNEYGCSKADGSLYEYVSNVYGKEKHYYHVGDNIYSDVKNAKKNGWDSFYYKNINMLGERYRPYGMSTAFGSIYNGLVNTWFYGNKEKRSFYYEYGFSCGGVLIVAYCAWLERLAAQEGIDRFWFIARDGNLPYQIYQKYWGTIHCEYIAFSRSASEQLVAEDFLEEYIEHAILPELETDTKTVRELFELLGIEELLKKLPVQHLSEDSQLTKKLYSVLREFIYENKENLAHCFLDARRGAKKYFEKKAGNAKKICVIDMGWRGTSIEYLKHLFECKYEKNVQICGALIGSLSERYSDMYELLDVIHVFAFSKRCHAEWIPIFEKYWKAIEMIFSSKDPTLFSYGLVNGKPVLNYAEQNKNQLVAQQIAKGVLDFADYYFTHMDSYAHKIRISGRDALLPLVCLLKRKNIAEFIEAGWKERKNGRPGKVGV